MKPLLAHVYEPHRVTYPCYVQPKLNGVRALYQAGRFQSRDGVPFPVGLLDHLAKPLLEVFGTEHAPLDGELYVHGWKLQRILGACTPVRQEQREDTALVEYHVFDVVRFDQTFEERVRSNAALICGFRRSSVSVFAVQTVHCGTSTLANELYTRFISEGYEGMMYRLGDCPYTVPKQEVWKHKEDGISFRQEGRALGVRANTRFLSDKNNRCWHLLKRKDWTDSEFDFISLRETEGEKGERGFQMQLRTASGKYFHVSSGLSESELDHYISNPPFGRKVKVKFLVYSDEGIPQNATILAVL